MTKATEQKIDKQFRAFHWLAAFTLGPLALVFAGTFWFKSRIEHDLDMERRAAVADGLPLSMEDYFHIEFGIQRDEPIPPYLKILKPFIKGPDDGEVLDLPYSLREDFRLALRGNAAEKSAKRKALAAVLELHKEAVAALQKAAREPVWRFHSSIHKTAQGIPLVSMVREIAQLLPIKALLSADVGAWDEALACVQDLSLATHRISDLQTLHSFTQQSDSWALLLLVEHLGSLPDCPRSFRDGVFEVLKLEPTEPSPVRQWKLMHASVYMDLFVIDYNGIGEEAREEAFSAMIESFRNPRMTRSEAETIWLHQARKVLHELRDPNATKDDVRDAIMKHEKLANEAVNASSSLLSGANIFSMMSPTTSISERYSLSSLAHRRVAMAYLEALNITLLEGKPPTALPVFGDSSIDPYDFKPLKYIRNDKGFIVYSIGHDGIDNKGTGSTANFQRNVDIAMRYPIP